jgi:hypothetical protein
VFVSTALAYREFRVLLTGFRLGGKSKTEDDGRYPKKRHSQLGVDGEYTRREILGTAFILLYWFL